MTQTTERFAIKATGLTRRYGAVEAVKGIDLQALPGEIFGFLGANGAGKSTTIRMLCGFLPPSAGRIEIAGYDLAREPLAVKRCIGVLLEEPVLYEKLTGAELLEFTGRMYGLTQKEAVGRASDLMEMLELSGARDSMICDYSMGMRKKTALAVALIHRPRVLFLDEPFNGMDTLAVRAVCAALRRLTEGGATVFFSSHVMEMVDRLCTRVAILTEGRIVACGTLPEVRAQAEIPFDSPLEDAYLALAAPRQSPALPGWL